MLHELHSLRSARRSRRLFKRSLNDLHRLGAGVGPGQLLRDPGHVDGDGAPEHSDSHVVRGPRRPPARSNSRVAGARLGATVRASCFGRVLARSPVDTSRVPNLRPARFGRIASGVGRLEAADLEAEVPVVGDRLCSDQPCQVMLDPGSRSADVADSSASDVSCAGDEGLKSSASCFDLARSAMLSR